jgi:hypothetical protein
LGDVRLRRGSPLGLVFVPRTDAEFIEARVATRDLLLGRRVLGRDGRCVTATGVQVLAAAGGVDSCTRVAALANVARRCDGFVTSPPRLVCDRWQEEWHGLAVRDAVRAWLRMHSDAFLSGAAPGGPTVDRM